MSIATPTSDRDPFDDDVDRLLVEIERCLLFDQAPLMPAPLPERVADDQVADEWPVELETVTASAVEADVDQDDEPEADDQGDDEIVEGELMPMDDDDASGETQLVRRLRRQVSEARRLVDLQADEAPLLVESKKVRRRRLAAIEAARLHELAQDPVALAYRDARVRRVTTAMVMVGVAVGLAVSSIGVQASVAAALILEKFSAAWWAAFLYEPAMSMPLLGTVAVQAYSAMRGKVVDRRSPAGKKMFRVEALLLALTLILNCAPAFAPGVAFSVLTVLVHSLGPVVAVTSVWVLPALWSVLEVLPVPEAATGRTGGRTTGPTARATAPKYSGNAKRAVGTGPRTIDVHRTRLRALIAAGKLPAAPSASTIRDNLNCGTDIAKQLRDELAGGAQ
ncbi:hypothetical protein [Nonomuraea endophytica]|uniref:hypothetical protein n=1 Tax=Nonomuraea endophytica TaxID=714136 RepID=UPI0037CC030B